MSYARTILGIQALNRLVTLVLFRDDKNLPLRSKIKSKFDTMDQRSSGKNSIVALVTSKRANTSLGQSGEVCIPEQHYMGLYSYDLRPQVKLEPGENDNLNPSGDLLDPLLARLAEQQQQGSAERQKSYKHKDAVRSRGGHSPADPRPELLNSDKTNMKFEPHTSNPNLGSLTDINITSVGNASEIYGYNPLGSLGEISRQTQSGQNRHLAMPEEATHTRANKRTLDQTTGHSYGGNYHSGKEITEQTISCLQNALASTAPRSAPLSRTEAWPFDDSMDLSSETPEPISGGNYNRQSTIWGTGSKSSISQLQGLPLSSAADYTSLSRSNSINDNDYFGPNRGGWGNRRTFSNQTGPGGPPVAGEQRGYSRRPSFNTGGTSFARTNFDFGVTGPHLASPTTASYTPSPIGTPLSPTATEFTASSGGSTVWNSHGQVSYGLLLLRQYANVIRATISKPMYPQLSPLTTGGCLSAV